MLKIFFQKAQIREKKIILLPEFKIWDNIIFQKYKINALEIKNYLEYLIKIIIMFK